MLIHLLPRSTFNFAGAIFRDEANYKNASMFDPDRFSTQNDPAKAILDPTTIAFGFGRRFVLIVLPVGRE